MQEAAAFSRCQVFDARPTPRPAAPPPAAATPRPRPRRLTGRHVRTVEMVVWSGRSWAGPPSGARTHRIRLRPPRRDTPSRRPPVLAQETASDQRGHPSVTLWSHHTPPSCSTRTQLASASRRSRVSRAGGLTRVRTTGALCVGGDSTARRALGRNTPTARGADRAAARPTDNRHPLARGKTAGQPAVTPTASEVRLNGEDSFRFESLDDAALPGLVAVRAGGVRPLQTLQTAWR